MHYREQVARMHEKRASELFRHSDKPAAFTSEYFSSTLALEGHEFADRSAEPHQTGIQLPYAIEKNKSIVISIFSPPEYLSHLRSERFYIVFILQEKQQQNLLFCYFVVAFPDHSFVKQLLHVPLATPQALGHKIQAFKRNLDHYGVLIRDSYNFRIFPKQVASYLKVILSFVFNSHQHGDGLFKSFVTAMHHEGD